MTRKRLIILSLVGIFIALLLLFIRKPYSSRVVSPPEPTRIPAPLTRTTPFIPWAPQNVVFTSTISPSVLSEMPVYRFSPEPEITQEELTRIARQFSFSSSPALRPGSSGFVARWVEQTNGSLSLSLDASGKRAAYSRYKSSTVVVGPIRNQIDAVVFAAKLFMLPKEISLSASMSPLSSLEGVSIGKDVSPPYVLYKIQAKAGPYPLFSGSYSETFGDIVTDSKGIVLSVKTSFPPRQLLSSGSTKPLSIQEALAGLNLQRGLLVLYENKVGLYPIDNPSFSSVSVDSWVLGYYASSENVYPVYLAFGNAEENTKLIRVGYFINAISEIGQ